MATSWRGFEVKKVRWTQVRALRLPFGIATIPPTTPVTTRFCKGDIARCSPGYGPVFEMWSDGAKREAGGKKQVWLIGPASVARERQPQCGDLSDAGPTCGSRRGRLRVGDHQNTIDRSRYEPGTVPIASRPPADI